MERLDRLYFSRSIMAFPSSGSCLRFACCCLLRIWYRWVVLILLIFANNLSMEGFRDLPSDKNTAAEDNLEGRGAFLEPFTRFGGSSCG